MFHWIKTPSLHIKEKLHIFHTKLRMMKPAYLINRSSTHSSSHCHHGESSKQSGNNGLYCKSNIHFSLVFFFFLNHFFPIHLKKRYLPWWVCSRKCLKRTKANRSLSNKIESFLDTIVFFPNRLWYATASAKTANEREEWERRFMGFIKEEREGGEVRSKLGFQHLSPLIILLFYVLGYT